MAEGRLPLSPSTLLAEPQQVCLGENLSKPHASRHDPEDLQQLSRSQVLLPITRSPIIAHDHDSSIFDPTRQLDGHVAADATYPVVEISPSEAVTRLTVTGHGLAAESVRSTSRSKIQHHFRAPMHMLVMYEKGERCDGETFVEGLPRSALRNLEAKLTFVPAGREFHEPMGTTAPSNAPKIDAVFGATGDMWIPNDYLTYQFLGSWALAFHSGQGSKELHVVYASPGTVAAYRKDGRLPDGAVLVKEVFKIATTAMTTGTVSHAKTLKGCWFVMVGRVRSARQSAWKGLQRVRSTSRRWSESTRRSA